MKCVNGMFLEWGKAWKSNKFSDILSPIFFYASGSGVIDASKIGQARREPNHGIVSAYTNPIGLVKQICSYSSI